jgi:hypothetical protein
MTTYHQNRVEQTPETSCISKQALYLRQCTMYNVQHNIDVI